MSYNLYLGPKVTPNNLRNKSLKIKKRKNAMVVVEIKRWMN